MYTTCLFCLGDLGRNEAVAAFPIGRRLAYDAARGRLWVVCRRCERWNLTPQEERWEAIEQAERLFRGTRLRSSTANVGLARLRDGTELVRIGKPLRPEFAAWRYGDQFGRRHRRQRLLTGGAVLVGAAAFVGGPVLGLYSLGGLVHLWQGTNLANNVRRARKQIRLDGEAGGAEGRPRMVSLVTAERTRLTTDDPSGFALVVPVVRGQRFDAWRSWSGQSREIRFSGERALAAATRLLAHVNRRGGRETEVHDAVRFVDDAGAPAAVYASVASVARGGRPLSRRLGGGSSPPLTLSLLAAPLRLALEMAAHEEHERRALDGELHELERAWRAAEEIAAIADDLLLPRGLLARLDQLRGRSSARAGAASSPTSDSGGASSS